MFRLFCTLQLVVILIAQSILLPKDKNILAPINFDILNNSQGFQFTSDNQDPFGYLVAININGTTLPADFSGTYSDPLNQWSHVVGILSKISWGGGQGDPIELTAQISAANKQKVIDIINLKPENANVNFKFVVFDYDFLKHTYYQSFYPGISSSFELITLNGIIYKEGMSLMLALDGMGSEVNPPENWTFTIKIAPQPIDQNITYGVGVGMYMVKQWGVTVTPVELTSFKANVVDNKVFLNWETATEINNYGFELERSLITDPQSLLKWETIGSVQGNGNSNSPKEYSFVDENPPAGNIYYRLKQIDTDGGYEYYPQTAEVNIKLTNVKEKQQPKEFSLEQNYPNPFNPTTVINYQLPVNIHLELKVYNLLGKEVASLVNEEKPAGYYKVRFDASELSAGMYIYQLKAGNFVITKKLLLLK